MKVKDAMHKGVDWVSPETPVTELAKLMRDHDIGSIPIGENDRLVGMVTDRDIVCNGVAEDGFDSRTATARDVMTAGIHCCREDDDLAKAVRHMEELKIRRLPVINKSMRMVGILSVGDVGQSAPMERCPNTSRAFPPITTERVARPADSRYPTIAETNRNRRLHPWKCRVCRASLCCTCTQLWVVDDHRGSGIVVIDEKCAQSTTSAPLIRRFRAD